MASTKAGERRRNYIVAKGKKSLPGWGNGINEGTDLLPGKKPEFTILPREGKSEDESKPVEKPTDQPAQKKDGDPRDDIKAGWDF